ncbi:major capsid protein [uncultured Celeribacter sp.]|uniref:major capsid protein n=1 Tax=uncultured Celeribacter sp. TaxID=1303376 RepID=UPI002AA79C73|nr:major capsid protein [uncultured Celeribacter sp.]
MNQSVNQRTAAVVDPILSSHARGYRNSEFISHLLFPRVPIPNRSMRVIRFGKESFRMLNTRRAPGANKLRIQYGYASDAISLVQDAVEAIVPIEHQEEAMSVPGIDLAAGAVNMVMDIIDLGHEIEAANLARDLTNYDDNNKVTLSGADLWSDDASDPAQDVKDAKEAIRRQIGRYPNVLTLGPSSFNSLTGHAKIKEQFKYTSKDSITAEMLAAYFDVEKVIVGKAVFLDETMTDDDPAQDVWGDDAILAYVPQGTATFQVPSYGYTYSLKGYPLVNQPYWENSNDSWIYPTKTERRVYLTGAEGGFLFKNAGASD